MKKFLLIAAAAMLSSQTVFANEFAVQADAADQVYELEEGAMSLDEMNGLEAEQSMQKRRPGAVIVIGRGGYIGVDIIEGRYGRNHNFKDVVCYAQNRRGQIFRAAGYRPRPVQAKALDKCYAQSAHCRPLGCQIR